MTVDVMIPFGGGGAREGSGRKPVADKKVQCYAFIPGSIIQALGGKQAVQGLMSAAVYKAHQELLGQTQNDLPEKEI